MSKTTNYSAAAVQGQHNGGSTNETLPKQYPVTDASDSAPLPAELEKATLQGEQEELTEKELSPLERARMEVRGAESRYKNVVTMMGDILQSATDNGTVPLDILNKLQTDVLALYNDYAAKLLIESLQTVRIDNKYYRHHPVNVALLNAMVGRLMDIQGTKLEQLVKLGLVIDLGMMQLPSKMLQGDQKLTREDLELMKQHPALTRKILEASGETDTGLLDSVLLHHERYNGQGYPQGLAGEQIPLETRITTVSDSFDAAISRKRYRKQKSPFEILEEFKANTDNALDPTIAQTVVNGFSQLLVGRYVALSDRSIGKVIEIDPDHPTYPAVRVVGHRVQTSPELYPVSLSGHFPLY